MIINQAGPLPISLAVDWPTSGPAVVAVSGSASTQKANTVLGVTLRLHNTTIGTVQLFANEAGTHFTLPTAFMSVTGGIGQATVNLIAANSTTATDENDHFTVAVIF